MTAPEGGIAPEVEAAPIGFLRVGRGGEILGWNSKLAALTDADPELRVGGAAAERFGDPHSLARWMDAAQRGGGWGWGEWVRSGAAPLRVRWIAVPSPTSGTGWIDLWVEAASEPGETAQAQLRAVQARARGMAHDLRNFLTVILGETQLLALQSAALADDPGVQAILNASQSALQLAADLRALDPIPGNPPRLADPESPLG
jgi:signal transduction histidine kinase